MKVLLLTDSVSLPRKHKEGEVQWEEIYFCKLQNKFPEIEFVLVGIGGATINQLQIALNYYALVKPDIIILQSGIVDCAPRALGQLEQQIIMKLHLFRFVRPLTNFLRMHRNICYTKPKVFEECILKIKTAFSDKPLIGIGILPGCPEYDNLVPKISDKIKQYNLILASHTLFIDNSNFPREGIINDFHHMNEKGHEIIFQKLVPMIENYKTKQRN